MLKLNKSNFKSKLGIKVYKNVVYSPYTDNYIDDFLYLEHNKRNICRMLQGECYGIMLTKYEK